VETVLEYRLSCDVCHKEYDVLRKLLDDAPRDMTAGTRIVCLGCLSGEGHARHKRELAWGRSGAWRQSEFPSLTEEYPCQKCLTYAAVIRWFMCDGWEPAVDATEYLQIRCVDCGEKK